MKSIEQIIEKMMKDGQPMVTISDNGEIIIYTGIVEDDDGTLRKASAAEMQGK